jgi:hypothetical protein
MAFKPAVNVMACCHTSLFYSTMIRINGFMGIQAVDIDFLRALKA